MADETWAEQAAKNAQLSAAANSGKIALLGTGRNMDPKDAPHSGYSYIAKRTKDYKQGLDAPLKALPSTEERTAEREKEKGQKQLQAQTKVQQKAQASSGGADSGWRDRIRNAKASDADLEIAFREYQNGRYTPGPKTLEYFRQMGWLGKAVPDEKTADTPKQPQKPVSQAVRDDGHTYESDYDAARNAFTGQKGWLYDMRDDMQYEFKKMGYDDGQAASLASSISNEMFDLGKTGEVTKQDLRALAAKYGLKNVSQLNVAAKEINKSHATLGKNWKRNIDGSWSPV